MKCGASRTYIFTPILRMMKLRLWQPLAQEDHQREVKSGFKPSLPDLKV